MQPQGASSPTYLTMLPQPVHLSGHRSFHGRTFWSSPLATDLNCNAPRPRLSEEVLSKRSLPHPYSRQSLPSVHKNQAT